jgi:hypothetical protein
MAKKPRKPVAPIKSDSVEFPPAKTPQEYAEDWNRQVEQFKRVPRELMFVAAWEHVSEDSKLIEAGFDNPGAVPAESRPAILAHLREMKLEQFRKLDAEQSTTPKPAAETDPFLSTTDIAERFCVTEGAARKRLVRWRLKHNSESGRNWIENGDAGAKEAKHIYKLSAIRHLFVSAICPAKK